jgi:hypothetical protein
VHAATKRFEIWLKGLFAAGISDASGGILTGLAAVGIDPQHFSQFIFYSLVFRVARSSLKNNSNLRGVIQYSFSEEGIRHQGTDSEASLGCGGLNRGGVRREVPFCRS